jgi:hypothetical protein
MSSGPHQPARVLCNFPAGLGAVVPKGKALYPTELRAEAWRDSNPRPLTSKVITD